MMGGMQWVSLVLAGNLIHPSDDAVASILVDLVTAQVVWRATWSQDVNSTGRDAFRG